MYKILAASLLMLSLYGCQSNPQIMSETEIREGIAKMTPQQRETDYMNGLTLLYSERPDGIGLTYCKYAKRYKTTSINIIRIYQRQCNEYITKTSKFVGMRTMFSEMYGYTYKKQYQSVIVDMAVGVNKDYLIPKIVTWNEQEAMLYSLYRETGTNNADSLIQALTGRSTLSKSGSQLLKREANKRQRRIDDYKKDSGNVIIIY